MISVGPDSFKEVPFPQEENMALRKAASAGLISPFNIVLSVLIIREI